MNDMIVGMENLPNVFIDKIRVYRRSNGFRILTNLRMYDYASSTPSWKNRIDDLKVKISYISDADSIENLNNGNVSLYDFNLGTTRTSVLSTNSFALVGTITDYDVFSFVHEEILPFLPQDLNIYAACFIDGLDFSNPMFNKFYGPMAAEQIFVGGQLNTLSNYFYYPDTNEEYGGPVHQKPDGSFMEGSEHSDQPHKDVRLVTEENYKIQAFDFDISVAPNNTGDIGSAGNLRDFLGTDLQAGSPPENTPDFNSLLPNNSPRDY